jgi:asparagine synthase (glutamine-hydrolysing)
MNWFDTRESIHRMCGIVGIFNHSREQRVSEKTLLRMRDSMAHRGPDDCGVYVNADGRLGLAHRRLSIIDLSELGRQPMSDDGGRIHITYNGEIYNFRELRSALEKDGVHFRSQSDTEVLVYLYKLHGKDMLHLLRGMFALGIWDEDQRTLFLARDRVGVKPLYYLDHAGCFAFASEIKALLAAGEVTRDVDNEAFYHYLSFLTTPAPQTLFKGIYKLPAGHWLTIHESGRTRTEQWWNPLPAGPAAFADEATRIEQVQTLLRESVRYRMVSDVPFGVCLSGGIDSSTIVALMAELMDRPVETFSIAFKGESKYNELEYARTVARQFRTNHHEIEIDLEQSLEFLPALIYHQDEPIADPVCIPLYYVAKLAKEHGVTVCQVGEGSDELFCGYLHWSYVLRLERLRQAYSVLPRGIRRIACLFARELESPSSGRLEYIRRASSDEPVFWGGAEAFFETHKQRLLSPDLRRRLNGASSAKVVGNYFREFVSKSTNPDPLNWMTFIDLKLRLPELLLMRVDKMTMATSLEARVPFLDHKLIEYVLTMPQSQKVPGYRTKYLLKKAVAGIIPKEIIDRPKQGFAVPITEWLQRELGTRIRTTIQSFSRDYPYFESREVERLLSTSNTVLPWYLFNFCLWHERWIEGKSVEAPRI